MRQRHSVARVTVVSLALSCACVPPIHAETPTDSATNAATTTPFQSRGLEDLLRSRPRLAEAADHSADHRFQVLLGVPDSSGTGWERREGFRVDAEYFYPASAIKPCIVLAALETLTELRASASTELDVRATFASTRRRSPIPIANLVRGALIVSDNDASNDLFDLTGFDGLHERLWNLGLTSARFRHRMGGSATDSVRITPRVELLPAAAVEKRPPVVIDAREGNLVLGKNEDAGVEVGESFVADGRVVQDPMSFEDKNRISIVDLQDAMVALMRPELRPADKRPNLGESERATIVGALTTLPRDWGMSASAEAEHKPLLPGLERVRPRASLTVASKSGRAFGFLVDNAYVADRKSGRSFFLTTAVYANANGRLNDDLYQYDALAYPLLADLGEIVARSVFDEAL